jgi:integrase
MAVTIAAHQGARMNAILHMQWVDVDLESRTIVWRARWDKTGREWRQPITDAAAGGLGIAWVWRERDAYAGPWVFYSSHARKRALGDDPRAVYHPTALLRALRLAESRAGVTHRPYRGMHGFRRAAAGDVARSTGNLKLAMEYIGDTDIRRARECIQVRPDHLKEAAFRDGPGPSQPYPDRTGAGVRCRGGVGTRWGRGAYGAPEAGLEPATRRLTAGCSTS